MALLDLNSLISFKVCFFNCNATVINKPYSGSWLCIWKEMQSSICSLLNNLDIESYCTWLRAEQKALHHCKACWINVFICVCLIVCSIKSKVQSHSFPHRISELLTNRKWCCTHYLFGPDFKLFSTIFIVLKIVCHLETFQVRSVSFHFLVRSKSLSSFLRYIIVVSYRQLCIVALQ